MSAGTTSIESLPNEIGKNNISMAIKETPKPTGPPPQTLSKDSINQIVSGLQDAAASGATVLPSRDLPTNQQHIAQDEQQKPNYVPDAEGNLDYIENSEDFEDMLKRGHDDVHEQDRLDMLYDELQTPLLVMILFFAFNLPYVNKALIKNMPAFFQRDGNPNLSGYLFKTFAFGVSFYGIVRSSRYLSEY